MEGASNSEAKLQSQSYYNLADQSLITSSWFPNQKIKWVGDFN